MTFKKTVGSLSFVLAATVSSIALAQGLGVAANANAGVGSAPVSANVPAGGQTNLDAPAGSNPNASLNNRSETALGSDTKGNAGAALGGATQAVGASAKPSAGTGLDTAAAAQVYAHDAPLKIAKAKKPVHAKTSANAGTQLKAQDAN